MRDEKFGRIREVRDMVWCMAFGDVVFGSCLEDVAELGFPRATGRGQVQAGKALLRLAGERVPVRFVEVDVCITGWGRWIGLEIAF